MDLRNQFNVHQQGGASLDDLSTNGKLLNQNISLLITVLQSIFRVTGTFTMTAATSITVPQTATQANSFPLIIPTNAAAATLMAGANSLYLSARVVGTSFTLSTAGGGAAAGGETFAYTLVTPV